MLETGHKPILARRPSGNLRGRIEVPGDKSISHRALMLSAIALGESRIRGLLEASDVANTRLAMSALGARITPAADGSWVVCGIGVGGLRRPEGEIDFGNSGTGVRLAAGLMATTPITTRLTGDASLCKRPMSRIINPLQQMGARFEPEGTSRLPLTLHGARHAVPIAYELPVASAQVKSAVLLAGLNTPGVTTVIEQHATRDHTERMLKAFGADISHNDIGGRRHIAVSGHVELTARDVAVPGDPSSAAFPIVAALITEGSEITIDNVLLNPTRIGLLETLIEMGADLSIDNRRDAGGEDVGTITARSSWLRGVSVPADRAPSMIDEYPVLAVAAAFAEGTTRMAGLGELRVKESDRLSAVLAGLERNGITARAGDDWLEVDGGAAPGGGSAPGGGTAPGGGRVETHLDHRIAMAFCVLGFGARKAVTIDDGEIIATSFPEFAGLMAGLGAEIAAADGVS